MAVTLQQNIVVDNRAGAGGMIGADIAAKAAPDGYTILLVDALHIISPILSHNTLYDPVQDFTPIAMVAKVPVFRGPREFNARVLSDAARWKKVAKDAGIKPAE